LLTAPLDTASGVWRPRAYTPDNTLIPNEGLLDIPLNLGATLNADTTDPVFVQEAGGNFLKYTLNQGQYAQANLPAESLNGDIWFALQYRPLAVWADRLLLAIVDPHPTTPLKRFMLHQTSGNKVMARFWATNSSQIPATSTTSVSLSRTDTWIVTWSVAEKKICLYRQGVLEASFVSPYDRQAVVSAPLSMPLPGTTLKPAGLYGPLATGNWTLTPEEASVFHLNPDWN
jgi:hypothetical protein